jgi:predicted small lipoprotein YifL
MKQYIPFLAVAPLMALAACGQSEPEVVGGPADPMADKLANAKPIELPPSVKANKTYRCKDNSLIYVDFLSDDKTANLRTEKGGKPTRLVAAEPGKPFTAEGGFEVSGSGSTITAAVPGKASQSCKS